MKTKLIIVISVLLLSLLTYSCGNNDAKKRYEQEKQAYGAMKKDHRREVERAIMSGASEPEIMILEIENAEKEKEQADRLYELAKEAGIK